MKPLVSICCITYNQENFVEETLKGFIKQKTTFPVEILVHDDASTDSTQKIISKYVERDSRFKVIFQTENKYSKGEKPLLNYLFPLAQGKYIAICEGDDYWTDPYKLQKQFDFLEQNPKYILTHHDADIINNQGELIKKSKLPKINQRDFHNQELKQGPFLLTLSLFFRNLPTNKNFPEEMFEVLNGDKFLISFLGNFGKGKFMPNIIPAHYRLHSGSIWSQKDSLRKKENLFVTYIRLAQYYHRLGDKEIFHYFLKKSEHINLKISQNYFAGGKFKKFKQSIIFYWKNSPQSEHVKVLSLSKMVFIGTASYVKALIFKK